MKLWALIKKEFRRFFHDPRLLVAILLPGLLIFGLYSVLGNIVRSEGETHDYKLSVAGESSLVAVLKEVVEESGSTLAVTETSAEEAQEAVKRGDAHLALVFSDAFDATLMGASAEVWYDVSEEESVALYQMASAVLQSYGMRFTVSAHSVTDEQDFGKTIMATMLPFLVVTFIFSACMSVTLESVAGEKERGTLATILATSVPRYQIALGKIVPLSCIAAIGAASSFVGVILSMPKLMGTTIGAVAGGYGFSSYLLLFILLISTVPLIVGAIAAVSTFSKSVKEASGYTSMIMILVMVLSLVTSYVELGEWVVAVPVLNAVTLMGEIMGGAIPVWQTLVGVGVNLVFTALLVVLVSRMLSSERIMFGK